MKKVILWCNTITVQKVIKYTVILSTTTSKDTIPLQLRKKCKDCLWKSTPSQYKCNPKRVHSRSVLASLWMSSLMTTWPRLPVYSLFWRYKMVTWYYCCFSLSSLRSMLFVCTTDSVQLPCTFFFLLCSSTATAVSPLYKKHCLSSM